MDTSLALGSLENLSNIFKNLGDYKTLLDKISKILESWNGLIHMLIFYVYM